jgi:hypothetical protein
LLAFLNGKAFFIVNITQLRSIVTGLLGASPNLIGSYTFPNGTQIPAVYVIGQQGVPQEWKVQGLEVTIRQFPQIIPRSPLSTLKLNQLWEVVLSQYSPTLDTLPVAMERMVRRFPDSTPRYFPGDDVAYERCRFVVPDMIIQTLLR